MSDQTVIGILPIKEHSERIPGKNFEKLGVGPLWMHALGNLAKSMVCDKIIINTDVPKRFGHVLTATPVEIEQRAPHICGDDIPMNVVIEDVVKRHVAEVYIQIHATSPFVTPERFEKSLGILNKSGADCAYAVTEHKSRFEDPAGNAINYDEGELLNTQELPPLFEENSAFYIFKRETILTTGNRTGGQRARIITSPIESIDIDWPGDMELARLIIAGRNAPA